MKTFTLIAFNRFGQDEETMIYSTADFTAVVDQINDTKFIMVSALAYKNDTLWDADKEITYGSNTAIADTKPDHTIGFVIPTKDILFIQTINLPLGDD